MTISNEAKDQKALLHDASAVIDREIATLLGELDGDAALLPLMARYHLGLQAAEGGAIPSEEQQHIQGKRMRPLLALLSCAAAGGPPAAAGSLAAAIELLHNFTLVHDDIQDRSPTRRHRPTVWKTWGDAQAINAGDAIFATAQIGVLNTTSASGDPSATLAIARAFNRMTIDIVRGQVLDLEFEGRSDVSPADYLSMIDGKTAAIVRFSAWAGAKVGGADDATAERFAVFGHALGLGFQIRDDALGVWGTVEATGKDPADDIRRRKQSFPVILLRSAASPEDHVEIDRVFGSASVSERDVDTILQMMERYGVADEVASHVHTYHDEAVSVLDSLESSVSSEALEALRQLTDRLAVRSG